MPETSDQNSTINEQNGETDEGYDATSRAVPDDGKDDQSCDNTSQDTAAATEAEERLMRAYGDSVTVDSSTIRSGSHSPSPTQYRQNNNNKGFFVSTFAHRKKLDQRNSLALRKLPVDILLKPETTSGEEAPQEDEGEGADCAAHASLNHDDDALDNESIDRAGTRREADFKPKRQKRRRHSSATSVCTTKAARSLLQSTCLNSKFSLRTQLMLSFGITSAITILLVVGVGLVASILAGKRVVRVKESTFEGLARQVAGTTAHYLADDLTPRLLPADLVSIVEQATLDRFAGYGPNDADDTDEHVPFKDLYTQTPRYPIVGEPLPLDWQIGDKHPRYDANRNNPHMVVTEDNYQEHVQNRWPWYHHSPLVSTASAAFYMQGMCDPNAQPGDHTYLDTCTENSNIISRTGDSYNSTRSPTLPMIYRKASDLSPLLKALYEYHQDVKHIGVYFGNSGAGAVALFPHYTLNSSATYTSAGCLWMLEPHPLFDESQGRTIFSLEEFERCADEFHQPNQAVPIRYYNPLDRQWCITQAQQPNQIHVAGPYRSAWSKDAWQISVGRAVYDRITREFIACISVVFVLENVDHILQATRITKQSEVTIVRYEDNDTIDGKSSTEKQGTVVASTDWNRSLAQTTVTIDELNVGVSQDGFSILKNLVDFSQPWTPASSVKAFEEFLLEGDTFFVAAFPMPPIPAEYSKDYKPEFLVIVSVREEEFFESVSAVQDSVNDKVTDLNTLILVVGCVGLGMMIVIIFLVANTLTAPLNHMNQVANDIIVHSFGNTDTSAAVGDVNNNSYKRNKVENDNDGKDENENDNTLSSQPQGSHSSVLDYDRSKVLLEHSAAFSASRYYRCVPRTELNDIVTEFLRMVREFSGDANKNRAERQKVTEIRNQFPLYAGGGTSGESMEEVFRNLYQSRQADPNFKYKFSDANDNSNGNAKSSVKATSEEAANGETVTKGQQQEKSTSNLPQRMHLGQNILTGDSPTTRSTRQYNFLKTVDSSNGTKNSMRSPLFFWIVVLIVTPLLLTTVSISAVLMINIAQQFPDFIQDAKDEFVEEEKSILKTYVDLRANLTAATMERSMRDLHVLTRYAGWLIFGGLNFSDTFTELATGIEECKEYENFSQCPFVEALSCDPDVRSTQEVFYVAESHDTDEKGNRNKTSYPNVSYSPQTTAWWDDITTVPGSERGPLAAGGYETTYDRMRSVSAIPVMQLLHNYDFYQQNTIVGTFVAFESDGYISGYFGCREPGHVGFSKWHSNVKNGAETLRPELCPLGKFGFDPRCRHWYSSGAKASGINESFVYATPPYLFASDNAYAQSASSPLVDPNTGEYVGQTLVDYVSQPILDSLKRENFAVAEKGFPILITIEADNFDADTVIGPGQSLQDESKPIADLVLANDPECVAKKCEEGFYKIVLDMKMGKSGNSQFARFTNDGSTENIHISYAPVTVKTFAPVDSSDFTRGVSRSDYLIYSLAFTEYENVMLEEFNKVEEDIETQFSVTLLVLCITIVLSTALVFFFSNVIVVSMTEPMLYLLEVVRHINRIDSEENIPEQKIDHVYGSREVLHVTITMERLYKVIRSANTAFFSGDVERCYHVLLEALELFKRLGNKKAIGVACNNLGNTMLAAYRTLKATKEEHICGFKAKEIIVQGTAWFHEAIQLGEKAYDDFFDAEGWSPNCLDFMQHLSNRYFNRAMFLLTVKDDHDRPKVIEELGKRDLQISRDMDVEINDEGEQAGWSVRSVTKTFEVMLSRFRGHLLILDLGYEDYFELDEWMREAFQILKAELQKEKSDLFQDMAPAGRMQQIESELMKYYTLVGDTDTAAKIAIRILVEDEFTLPSAQLHAVRVLQAYCAKEPKYEKIRDVITSYKCRLEEAIADHDTTRVNAEAEDAFDNLSDGMGRRASFGLSEMFKASNVSVDLSEHRRISLLESTRGEITMETF